MVNDSFTHINEDQLKQRKSSIASKYLALGTQGVRAGAMHAMKGLEFQAVAVIGVEQGLVPEPAAVTSASEDAVSHAQDLQRERCVLFVACTRARDHLYVSGTGEPSMFLDSHEIDPSPSERESVTPD